MFFFSLNFMYTDRELNGFVMNLRSSFYGKLIYNHSLTRREVSSIRGGRAVVASVVYNA